MELKELIQELILHLRQSITLMFESIKLNLAIWLSNLKQKATNKRYFVVLLTVGYSHKGIPKTRLRSINNEDFKILKRKKWLPKSMTTLELEQKCFYATALSKNNSWSYEERQRAKKRYLEYYKMMHKLNQ